MLHACMHVCMHISPAPGCHSKLTHTCVEIDTCAFQTGCQLSSAASGIKLNQQICISPAPGRIKIKPIKICISPAPGRSSKLTQTCVEIDTCAFQTGCQLSSVASGMSLELRFFARFQWREAYVLDNWQLAEMPQSGGREFDPRRVHDIYRFHCGFTCVSLCQSIKINPTNMYVCMYVCMPEIGAKVNWQWGQVGWMLADHRDGLSSSSF